MKTPPPGSRPEEDGLATLFKTVVAGGYCIGCGVCAALPGSPVRMELDKYGRYQAVIDGDPASTVRDPPFLQVCPFSGHGKDEDEIGRELFASEGARHDSRIGYHLATFAGHVVEDSFRRDGSSGGMGTWVLAELYRRQMVDRVIHVRSQEPQENDKRLFRFEVSCSMDEIRAGAKSRYYPVELSSVLRIVRDQPGRYAIVGIPCFLKAVRLLACQDPVVRDRIVYYVGIVCGHLKSSRFSELFAWQSGIRPGGLHAIDFRKKIPGQNANKYGIEIEGAGDTGYVVATRSNHEFFGYLWGHGFFKYEACDYCDDVFAETSDITLGDAWLAPYVNDSNGSNIVVVRKPALLELLENGIAEGRLHLERIGADPVAKSQDAGLRHRRDGLAYRLYLKDRANAWRPRKRVQARADHLDRRTRQIHDLRMQLAAQSHIQFERAIRSGSFALFQEAMTPLVEAYQRLYRKSRFGRWKMRLKRTLSRLKSSLLRR